MTASPSPSASLIVSLGIPGLALGVWALALYGVHRTLRESRTTVRVGLASGAWLLYTALIASAGLLARTDFKPLPMLLLFLPLVALSVSFAFSRVGGRLAQTTPLQWLLGLHAFRLPLELVMHEAAREQVMPVQMTFTGSLLLSAIVAIALASLPAFHRFGTEPEQLNTWVAYFPYVWLPAVLVAAALIGHLLLWRRLLSIHAGVACNTFNSASGSTRLT